MKKKALRKLYRRCEKVAQKGLRFLQKTIKQSILISVLVFISPTMEDRFYFDIKIYHIADEFHVVEQDDTLMKIEAQAAWLQGVIRENNKGYLKSL